ncbi:MAG TPA: thiamine phosphate synthase [Kofleriaceae bacterium]|nr:thiamine phosphate synthase [Kofleriaceae bacterium]
MTSILSPLLSSDATPLARTAPTLREAISGFYAVLDREDVELARALVRTARVLQLRIKPRGGRADALDLMRAARMVRAVCDEAGAAFIVNDRIDIALAANADGVHLGQSDLPLAEARRMLLELSRPLWVGISTHNVEQVRAAVAGGADYLGFGPVFATATKENPDPVQGIAGLEAAVAEARGVPIVAIGGVQARDAAALYRAGAQAICAISAVNGTDDPEAAGRLFQRP